MRSDLPSLNDPLLTYRQAADLLGVRLPTLYAMVSKRTVPFVRLSGRMVRFHPRDLDRWIAERRVLPSRSASTDGRILS